MTQLNRSQFLRGSWIARALPKRPPWSVEESLFTELCNGCKQCGDCVVACPEKILINGRGNFPSIDFSRGYCSFCNKCAEACPSGAISLASGQTWNYKAVATDSCLSTKGVECRSCGEICETSAISFHLKPGGIAEPTITQEACSGCGECIGICPVNALSIETPRGQS